jgi:hypothetical protein
MTEHAPRAAPDPSRRSFLKAVPALAVLAAPVTAQAAPPVATHATGAAASTGYHETEHIRRYYRTAAYW